MTKNTMALFPTVCFLSLALGCGAGEPSDLATACPPGQVTDVAMNCYTPGPGTGSITTVPEGTGGTIGTATSTDTGIGSTTGTSTATSVTATSITTSTATYMPVNITMSNGQYCTSFTDPRESAAEGPLDLSGTWKVTASDGKELFVLKASYDPYLQGQTTACGIPTGTASPKQIQWTGVSLKKCIAWRPVMLDSSAPQIQGTGIAADATGTTCIVGGNPALKICRVEQTVPGCP